jgi:hypothetical protein
MHASVALLEISHLQCGAGILDDAVTALHALIREELYTLLPVGVTEGVLVMLAHYSPSQLVADTLEMLLLAGVSVSKQCITTCITFLADRGMWLDEFDVCQLAFSWRCVDEALLLAYASILHEVAVSPTSSARDRMHARHLCLQV